MLSPKAEAALWRQRWGKAVLSCSLRRILRHPFSSEMRWDRHAEPYWQLFFPHASLKKQMYLRTHTMYWPLSLISTSTPSISALLASFFNHSILRSSSKPSPPLPKHLWALPSADLPGTGLPSCQGKNNFCLCHLKPRWWSPGFSRHCWYWEIPCISTYFVTIFYVPYHTPLGLSHCWLQEQTMEQQERPCDVLVQL